MFSITARLNLPLEGAGELLEACGLEIGGRVQKAIDQSVIDFCQPYVPASPNRTLEFSAQPSTEIGSGEVIWNTPYAHYQYMGIVYGPNFKVDVNGDGVLEWRSPKGKPKFPTGRELTYDTSQNQLAGPRWFERMKADRLNDLLNVAQRAIKEG